MLFRSVDHVTQVVPKSGAASQIVGHGVAERLSVAARQFIENSSDDLPVRLIGIGCAPCLASIFECSTNSAAIVALVLSLIRSGARVWRVLGPAAVSAVLTDFMA